MEHIRGESREQMVLYAETIDGIIEENNPVRIIDIYVDKLDFKKLEFKVKEAVKGRPSYTAALLLKIYIYGYLNKIRSSRKLENECQRNMELIWLTCRLAPDFKTIADFRKDNIKGIKNIFREFLKVCHKLELLSFQLTAIDGTKISAQNSMGNIYRRENIEEVERKIKEKIDKYIAEMEENDKAEENEFEFLSKNIGKKLEKLRTHKEKVEIIKRIFEADPELEVYYANDHDSRLGQDKGKPDVMYNAQTAVDEKNKLIVAVDVTNENNDKRQMGNMVSRVEEIKYELNKNSQTKTLHVLDAGYYSEREIIPIIECGIDVYAPSPHDENVARSKNKEEKKDKISAKEYKSENFKYDKESDQMICPDGNRLKKEGVYMDHSGRQVGEYRCRSKDCKNKDKCTNNKEGRRIKRSLRKEDMDCFDEKVRSEFGKKIMAKRKELSEHPFGTIKRNLGYPYFLLKGYDKVKSEFNFTSFIYNFKRVLNIVGFERFLEAI